MSLTDEQQAVINFAKNATEDSLLLIDAIAGSGKTFLLTQLVKAVKHKTGVYLAYNKSVATEAASKFPSTINCSTSHALAYKHTVKPHKLKVGTFGFKTITEPVSYEAKMAVVDTIKAFCLSAYTDFEAFSSTSDYGPSILIMAKKYLKYMWEGSIECTHDFYMKVFHIDLAEKHTVFEKLDILMVDEAGDLNPVTLEIFKLIPAKLKVAVGDKSQNIYAFNHTINAFKVLEGQGALFSLTKSFRVSDVIAKKIESFCHKYIDSNMKFEGIPVTDTNIRTIAFIGRTNAALIHKMNQLRVENIDYSLVRNVEEVFKLPLVLTGLKYQGQISDPAYKFIQEDVNFWYEDEEIKKLHPSPLAYIAALYELDKPLSAAARLVMTLGKSAILDVYKHAKASHQKNTGLWLGTSHSVKGLEFDSVVILDDLNTTLLNTVTDERMSEEEKLQEYNLYYVACSRAKKELQNATCL